MSFDRWNSARVSKGIAIALALAISLVLIALVNEGRSSGIAAQSKSRLDASLLTYDGKDFVRTNTTLKTEAGKSAVNTKLEHSSSAYKFLSRKESYTGETTIFGRKYEAHYAPVVTGDGRLRGALFVGVPK